MECAHMQPQFSRRLIRAVLVCGLTTFLLAQQPSNPKVRIEGSPSEPIANGTCTSSTFGYMELNGNSAGFSDAEFGKAIRAALRQGYVLTIYPPTKRGTFINQDCHGATK